MAYASKCKWHACGVILISLWFVLPSSQARPKPGSMIKSQEFLSPKIELEPGQVSNKVYLDMDFPKGHIAIKSFDAELVNEHGDSVPLYDTYLHHWLVYRFYQEIKNQSNLINLSTSGVCTANGMFGSGAETRRTLSDIPGRYGLVVGNPAEVPEGYREQWVLNVHAIDTRDVVDKVGCLECRCDLYSNISTPVPGNYSGGLNCCMDGARCKVNHPGSPYGKQILYLRYTIKYVDWDAWVLPARIYILDVTNCQTEYDVKACPRKEKGDHSGCIDSKIIKVAIPKGGKVIYGIGHLHVGGIAIAVYGKGGREICTSYPKYGTGKEAGNEAGYLVGMSACYPRPGSIKIGAGERVTLVSNYSSAQRHTGVMGLFGLMLAD